MSTGRGTRRTRRGQARSLLGATREFSTAAVMLHAAVAQRVGLGLTDLKALDVLQRRGAQTAGALSIITGLTPPSVTSLVDRLRRRGMVTRRRDPADRRRILIRLTPKLDEEVFPLFADLNRRMQAHFARYRSAQARVIRECLMRAAHDLRAETARIARGDAPGTREPGRLVARPATSSSTPFRGP